MQIKTVNEVRTLNFLV